MSLLKTEACCLSLVRAGPLVIVRVASVSWLSAINLLSIKLDKFWREYVLWNEKS